MSPRGGSGPPPPSPSPNIPLGALPRSSSTSSILILSQHSRSVTVTKLELAAAPPSPPPATRVDGIDEDVLASRAHNCMIGIRRLNAPARAREPDRARARACICNSPSPSCPGREHERPARFIRAAPRMRLARAKLEVTLVLVSSVPTNVPTICSLGERVAVF